MRRRRPQSSRRLPRADPRCWRRRTPRRSRWGDGLLGHGARQCAVRALRRCGRAPAGEFKVRPATKQARNTHSWIARCFSCSMCAILDVPPACRRRPRCWPSSGSCVPSWIGQSRTRVLRALSRIAPLACSWTSRRRRWATKGVLGIVDTRPGVAVHLLYAWAPVTASRRAQRLHLLSTCHTSFNRRMPRRRLRSSVRWR